MHASHSSVQLSVKVLIFRSDTGCAVLLPIHPLAVLHFTQHHFGMVDEILVHIHVIGLSDIGEHPIGQGVFIAGTLLLQLLKEQDIRCNLRPGKRLECRVGQPDGSDEIGSAGNVFPDVGILFVHRAFTGNKGDNAAGLHKVKGFGNRNSRGYGNPLCRTACRKA